MIAISLWQPWATALLLEFPDRVALKPDETRHWDLPARCVGVPVAIHAAARKDPETKRAWLNLIGMHYDLFKGAGIETYDQLPRGCVVGQVTFSAGVSTVDAKRRLIRCQHLMGNYDAGRFAWPTTARTRYFTPIPVMGRQGFFNFPSNPPGPNPTNEKP